MPVSVFLPCRKGSVRVPRKNIKPFGRYDHGLIELKLTQLLASQKIDRIFLSTNDAEIIDYANSLDEKRIVVHRRAEHLASSETSTDELVAHALALIGDGDIMWTHVTSPFLNARKIDEVVEQYAAALLQGYDSLMTVTKLQGFIWDKDGPISYDRKFEKWPRTQTIAPLFEINSGIFLADAKIYRELEDRIGQRPYLYELDKISGFDIDWEDDFRIAQAMIDLDISHV